MLNIRFNKLSVLIASVLGLSGCGGGGGGSSEPSTQTYLEAQIIDGYLQKANVWLDLNGNSQLDPNEPKATSGRHGIAMLNITHVEDPEQYSIIAEAIAGTTVDESTGLPVLRSFALTAPKGKSTITPLSTLVQLHLAQHTTGGETDEQMAQKLHQAQDAIANSLGLQSGDVLIDYIEADNQAALYSAENIVSSGVLPQYASLYAIYSEDEPTISPFTSQVEIVNQTIKQQLDDASHRNACHQPSL